MYCETNNVKTNIVKTEVSYPFSFNFIKNQIILVLVLSKSSKSLNHQFP